MFREALRPIYLFFVVGARTASALYLAIYPALMKIFQSSDSGLLCPRYR